MTTKQRFFYTTHTPYKWSSGPQMNMWNDDGECIASLEEAEQLALKHRVISYGDNCVTTSFGMLQDTPMTS